MLQSYIRCNSQFDFAVPFCYLAFFLPFFLLTKFFYVPLRDIQQSYSTPYFSQFSTAQTSLALWLQDLLKTKVGQNDMSEKIMRHVILLLDTLC